MPINALTSAQHHTLNFSALAKPPPGKRVQSRRKLEDVPDNPDVLIHGKPQKQTVPAHSVIVATMTATANAKDTHSLYRYDKHFWTPNTVHFHFGGIHCRCSAIHTQNYRRQTTPESTLGSLLSLKSNHRPNHFGWRRHAQRKEK